MINTLTLLVDGNDQNQFQLEINHTFWALSKCIVVNSSLPIAVQAAALNLFKIVLNGRYAGASLTSSQIIQSCQRIFPEISLEEKKLEVERTVLDPLIKEEMLESINIILSVLYLPSKGEMKYEALSVELLDSSENLQRVWFIPKGKNKDPSERQKIEKDLPPRIKGYNI